MPGLIKKGRRKKGMSDRGKFLIKLAVGTLLGGGMGAGIVAGDEAMKKKKKVKK